MNKEIENLIKKSMSKSIQIKMLERKLEDQIISEEIVLEILNELTQNEDNKITK